MVLPSLSWSDVGLLAVYVAVLAVPGGLVGLAAGLRGWTLAAAAPLLGYGVAGLFGPWSAGLGIRWSPMVLMASAVLVGALLVGLRRLVRTDAAPHDSPWARAGHLAVAICVLVAGFAGLTVVVRGMGGLDTIPQDWDAVFHANGIRWIVETGDGGLYAMTQVNWYELPGGIFYPNAYHLLAAVADQLTGRSVPAVLNANTGLLGTVLALGVVALVRRFGGRAIHAGAAALLVVAASGFYGMLFRGPLLPFAMGVALMPVALVLAWDFLDGSGWRDRLAPGALLVLGAASLMFLHPGALISAVILGLPAIVLRWCAEPGRLRDESAALFVIGVLTCLACAQHLVGAAQSAASASEDWPATLGPSDAVGRALLFGFDPPYPQWWLAAPLVLGLLAWRRLGELRWICVSAGAFAGLFVVAASYDTWWSLAITRPWWNDAYRLIGIAVVPLAIIAGHGVAELQRRLVLRLPGRPGQPRRITAVSGVAGAVVLGALLLASNGLYAGRNEAVMSRNTGEGPAVSSLEVAGYAELARLVPPGSRVLNDRGDGSVWMYALDGVRPVAGHYYSALTGPDSSLLEAHFNEFDTNEAVRAAAARLEVTHVAVGRGFLRPTSQRQPGLVGLERVRSLRLVYANPDFTIYRLNRS